MPNFKSFIVGCFFKKYPLAIFWQYSKTCLNGKSQKDRKLFSTNYRLMQVANFARCSMGSSAIVLTSIKLQFVIKIFVLSIFEWPFYTGFIV